MFKSRETKKLLSVWRSFINESSQDRTFKMIDTLESNNCKIVIRDVGELVRIEYRHKSNRSNISDLYGTISCYSSRKALRKSKAYSEKKYIGIGKNEVNPTWYIKLTDEVTKGMGPLLYEVLIEYISKEKNSGLKPDWFSVTKEAESVWEKFNNRSDIKKIQLDIDIDTSKKYSISQITGPDTETYQQDDTNQESSLYHLDLSNDSQKDMWRESPLSKTYRKDNDILLRELEKRDLINFSNF